MRLLYFAGVREAIGVGEEEREVPDGLATPGALVDWLSGQEDRYAAAFADRTRLRCAIDQRMAKLDEALGDAREIAFFPPVTGG